MASLTNRSDMTCSTDNQKVDIENNAS
jgi:hypothetical protein